MCTEDIPTKTDVLIVGAGPAGYAAAIRAGQLGLDATLVEKDAYGGTCLNHGCIPSKALISASDLAYDVSNAEKMGINSDPEIDLAGMVEWKDGVVDQLTGGVEKLCKANGVTLIEGTARFTDERTVSVATTSDETRSESIEFEYAIVATGSRPVEIPQFSFADEPVLNSRQALALESTPESLLVVGAGYIGMELASVFAKLGTDVTVIEMLEDVLPGYDSDLKRPVRDRAAKLGIDFHFGYTAEEWTDRDDGVRVIAEPVMRTATDGGEAVSSARTDDETLELEAEKVLVAVGREPVSDTLDLEETGVKTDGRGFISTDDRTRTRSERIFAVGDIAGEPMLAHKGAMEGRVAAEVVAGEPAAVDYQAMPAVVFTDPEIATVGLTETEAENDGFETVVGQFPFRASGRALTTDRADGFVRIIGDADGGFVLGGQVVGPDASELVAELGLAIEMGARLEDIAGTIHAHPTLSEAVMEAAENALGRAIHSVNR